MKRYLLAVLVTLACLTAIADAQFAITGTVYYGGYESVGGVKLELHSSQPGTPLLDTVISDYDGTYRFENVPEGEYGLWVYGPDDDNADLVTWNVTVVDADVTQDVAVFKALQRRSPYNHGVVATPNPRLTWAPQNDAEYYIVTLYHHEGQNFNQIAQSGLLYTAEWTISDALTPGESYGWTLEAYNWMEEAVGISEGMSDFTVEATESLETLLTQARGLMADRSLSGWRAADALLETGVATYGTENPELVFLHTLTRSMMLLIRDDGGDWDSFFELLGQFDIFILGDLLDELEPDFTLNEFGYYSKPGDAPTRDDIRNKLDTNTIPKLADILNELGAIESQSNFQMYLYPGETGLYRDVDVDYSDVIILRAALKALKARLETRWAYDTYLTEAEEDAIAQKIDAGVFDINDDLLSPHPYFMTLLPTPGHEDEDGLVRLQQAKQNSLDAIADYFIAVDAIRAETDDQTDDLFYIKETNSHGVDVMDARLTTLQQSLLDSQPGTYPWETTRTYFLMDGDEQEYNLTLTFDFNEADGDAGSFIVPSAVLELTDWRVKDLERCGDELYIDLEPNEPYVGGAAFLLCLLDGDSIINATFDYWGDYNGVISGLSGDLTNTNILTKRFDPTPLFAGEVEPRDMLPDYGPNNRPLPDTMGAGLDYDPTLGDIFPDMTQDDWNEMFDLQPAGEFDFPVVTSGAITADGSLDDWASWEIAPVFIDRTGDADFDPRYQADGIDIHELYIAQDIMTDTVFGAVTSAPIEFLPIAGGADTDYAIIFEYNNGYEPVIIRINMPFDTATGSADIWGNGSLVGTGTAIRSGNVVEFAITPDIPRTPHGGRMLAVHSHYIINGNSYAADENDTGLQYTSSNAISLMRTISGTVTYADYPNAPIIVQAFNDLDDPDGSVLASTMTDGSGSYTLEGIGLGWDGYVRAWAYWHGDTSMYAINGSRVRADYQYVNVASGSLTGINFELGRTITVGEEGDYAFIQDAIDAAQDGDRVFIYEGVYSGYSSSRNIDLNFMGKAITVEGENAPNGVVIDCYYEGNHRGFTFNHGEGPASILRGVTIINGWAPDYATDPEFGPWWGQIGGAIVCDETSPTITNCIFEMCDADYAGALACVNEAAPLIRDCIFQECSASQGGAAACLGNSDVTFENVQFQANAANIDYEIGSGGAVYGEGGSCDFINCLFAGNDCAEYGSAIYSYDQTTNLINCTITDNSAYYAGAVYSDMSWMSLTNCIVWDNISEMSPANPIAGDVDSVTYTCIDDGNPGDGNVPFGGVNNGNIDTNPEFVEYGYWGLYGWVPGDYHLQSGSHCIDSGNDDAVANVATDLDGSPRIQGSHVDMGAYEGAAGPLPDIVAEYIDITDEDADNVYYSFGLANAGGEITSNFYVTFYASEDEYFDPQYDHYLEMTTIGAPVPEGWWLNFDDWTLDRYYLRLPDGVYHLIVVADCDAPPMFYPVVAESDETNNWAVSPQTFTVHGEEFHLSITTQGEGEVSASPPSDPYGYYPVNTEVELTPQSASGWHFAYWWIDNEITMDNVPLYVIMDMDHEVSAVFEPDEVPQYTLNVSVASGSGSIRLTPSGGIYEQGSQVLVRALPESGWRFDHWTGDLIEASNPVLVTMDEDITAAAVFERITTPDIVYYDLTTAVTAGQGIIIPAGGTYQENTTVTLKAVAASGWRVLNWSGANSDPATGQTSVQVTMNANRHVTVAFEKVYTLTTSVIGDLGTISPDGGTYSEGTVVTLTVTPPANYCVKGWLGADNVPAGGELTNTVTMNADKTVRVLCEPLTGSLTAAIIPTLAQLDGAQWRVDGGEWHNSGDAINQLPIGSHTVSFQDVTGWTTPADIAVTISADALTSVQGTYVGVLPQEIETGTLRVWLTSPDGVITPSPQWRLAKVSGWLSGGAILSDIEPGIYEVEFSEVTGWTTPASAPVQIDPGQTTTYSAVYQKIIVNPLPQTGTLIVTSAATDQARWRLADQSWQSTGVTLGDMNPGVYTLQFSSLDDNWLAPGSQTVIIYPGQTTTVSPAFTPVKNAIFVDPDGSNTGNGESGAPYGTIQWAIDRATSGETIVVQPGTYTGPGNVDLDFRGKAITLRSAEGADTCIIDGNGSESHPHRGFWFHSKETADSIVDGFTITCGWATVGGGIFCDGADPTIRNCVIKSNTSLYSGAGLRCNNAAPSIEDCEIIENHALLCGGGVFCYAQSEPTIVRTDIRANSADGCGGGIYCCVDSAPTLANCLIVENEAASTGGGVYCGQDAKPILILCTIAANSANLGGGLRAYGADVTLSNSIIYYNTSRLSGRQIDNAAATLVARYCDIQGCGGSGANWNSTCGDDGGNNLDIVPGFVNLEASESLPCDFHLNIVSPCIDAGNPNIACTEPAPNGDRMNIGAYANTAQATITLDSDLDGLTNPQETRWGLNPYSVDSDGDGLTDPLEILLADSDPAYLPYQPATAQGIDFNAAAIDTDGDGADDFTEANYDGNPSYQPYNPATGVGTDPNALAPDTDGDGMLDGCEIKYGFNPLDPSDGDDDKDGDGYDNRTECQARSNPLDKNSVPPAFAVDFELAQRTGGATPQGQVLLTVAIPDTDDILSIGLTWPDAHSVSLSPRARFTGTDILGASAAMDLSALEAAFPAGLYTVTRHFAGDVSDSVTFEHWYGPYPAAPVIVSPTTNGATDVSLTPTLQWTGNVSRIDIFTGESSNPIFSTSVSVNSTSFNIPDDILENTTTYRLELTNNNGLTPYLASTAVSAFTTTTPLIIYVDKNAQGAEDGSSWENAYRHLGLALVKATPGTEVRVAQGTYYPDEGWVFAAVLNLDYRLLSFEIPEGVTLKGGFMGGVRDVINTPTILSGYVPSAEVYAYHVVTGAIGAVLDGCVITAGRANGKDVGDDIGGGLLCMQADMIVSHCVFTHNRASYGGAVGAIDSTVKLDDCLLVENTADYGGAACAIGGTATLSNCTLADNAATKVGGGAIAWESSVLLTNSITWGNTAPLTKGPQLALTEGSHLTVASSCIKGDVNLIYREAGATLTYGVNNIARSPRFETKASYESLADMLSAYRPAADSACIDGGNNATVSATTDLPGNPRIYNGDTVDMGAVEQQSPRVLPSTSVFNTSELTLRAGITSGRGSAVFKGLINFSSTNTDLSTIRSQIEYLAIQVGPFQQTFDLTTQPAIFTPTGMIFLGNTTDGGRVYLMVKFEANTTSVNLMLMDVSLGGITSPCEVQIELGDYQHLVANPAVIVPLPLLAGYADVLRVDSLRFTHNDARPGADMLNVRGGLCLAQTPADPKADGITITYGAYEITIPANNLRRIGSSGLLASGRVDGTTVLVMIDLSRCTFQVLIFNATIGHQPEPTVFGLKFAGFEQLVQLDG